MGVVLKSKGRFGWVQIECICVWVTVEIADKFDIGLSISQSQNKSVVNIFNGLIVCLPVKSLNEEAFSTSEHEEENKEKREVMTNPERKSLNITKKVYKKTPCWKIDERDGKNPVANKKGHISNLKDATPSHSHQTIRVASNLTH